MHRLVRWILQVSPSHIEDLELRTLKLLTRLPVILEKQWYCMLFSTPIQPETFRPDIETVISGAAFGKCTNTAFSSSVPVPTTLVTSTQLPSDSTQSGPSTVDTTSASLSSSQILPTYTTADPATIATYTFSSFAVVKSTATSVNFFPQDSWHINNFRASSPKQKERPPKTWSQSLSGQRADGIAS